MKALLVVIVVIASILPVNSLRGYCESGECLFCFLICSCGKLFLCKNLAPRSSNLLQLLNQSQIDLQVSSCQIWPKVNYLPTTLLFLSESDRGWLLGIGGERNDPWCLCKAFSGLTLWHQDLMQPTNATFCVLQNTIPPSFNQIKKDGYS